MHNFCCNRVDIWYCRTMRTNETMSQKETRQMDREDRIHQQIRKLESKLIRTPHGAQRRLIAFQIRNWAEILKSL